MSEHILRTIEEMEAKLREYEQQVVSHKKLINQLCVYAGLEVKYPDTELQPVGNSMVLTVKRNSFFSRPLTTCVKEYLEMRKRAGLDAAPLDEIFKALQEGGYHLDDISTKGEAEQRRGVAISLAKNSSTFVRLASKDWGLLEWYPNLKRRRAAENGGKAGSGDDEPEASAANPSATGDLNLPIGEEPATAEGTK